MAAMPGVVLYKTALHRAGNYSQHPVCQPCSEMVRSRLGRFRVHNGRSLLFKDPDAEHATRSLNNKFTRLVLFRRADEKCEGCGHALDWHAASTWNVDHIVPMFRGGKTCGSNLQVLCRDCHDAKSAREKSAATRERRSLQAVHRWRTHLQKDAEIERLRKLLIAHGVDPGR